jgi:hypothetical protein
MLVVLFTFSMFLSATLLFLVEPMLAKMILPMLGGTPAVWNTCLVFYQAMLLAGYLYAHAAMKWFGRRTQIAVHMAIVLSPFLILSILPLHLPPGWEPPAQANPVPWLFALLFVSVGLPFFALAASTPILQRWYADSGSMQAADPYFLYAASNAGSLVGLLAYPLLLEPMLRLTRQSHLWTFGYMLFVALTLTCGLLTWSGRSANATNANESIEETDSKERWLQRLRWVALAFVPSSLMMGVTTALTTEVPAIPLFWILPLAIYLISFVLVFAKHPPIPHKWLVERMPFLILIALFPSVSHTELSFGVLLILYLLVLFGVAMVCHGELAGNRPGVSRLTEFYLWISIGGVAGGIFNALVAPMVFKTVLEFPLVLIFAALLYSPANITLLSGSKAVWAKRKDWLLPLALGLTMVGVNLGLTYAHITPGRSLYILIFGYSMLWCLSFGKRRLRFALGLIALLIASSFYKGAIGQTLDTERNFFGVSRVTTDSANRFHTLLHGRTLHGLQSLDAAKSREPLTYYTKSGPVGQIIRAQQARMPRGHWAFVGLGAGTLACYLQPGQTITYYEINPEVARIAENPQFFTFLQECAPHATIVLGDARMKLRDAPDAQYDLIVLDAFSADSIPIHLMTKEALALYLDKLAPGGVIAFHISNRYLDLEPPLDGLARDGHLFSLTEHDLAVTESQAEEGKLQSIWVVMARNKADLASLAANTDFPARWTQLETHPRAKVWTDDYSNLLSTIHWTESQPH